MIYLHDTHLSYKQYKKTYHMIADSLKELHEGAQKIGIKKEWFQDKKRCQHYDIFGSKIKLAIDNGAKIINDFEFIRLCKEQVNEEL